ncbi:MAG: FHA domain-containing protein [Gemmataceae bacterium]
MAQKDQPEPTRLESADEILKAIEARKARKQAAQATSAKKPAPPPAPGAAAAPPPAPPVPEARRERPTQRPPMAVVCVFDDGPIDRLLEGELVRLRGESTVIGRSAGDILIPHDGQISGEHAEIVREWTGSGWRWLLNDLGSTNGTFVRVGKTPLLHDSEILVGQGRYRFESGGGATEIYSAAEPSGTMMPQPVGSLRPLVPSLVEIAHGAPINRFPLTAAEYVVGRDPAQCAILRPDDLTCDPRHARLYRRGMHWYVKNEDSLNGLWLRVKSIPLAETCHFRLGEQRFLFRTV